MNDARVFSKSSFGTALQRNALNLPSRGVFLGDDAFPLQTNLLKPYSRCGPLSETQRVFNYRLSRARRVVENAFGLLVARFRIFEKPIPLSLRTTEQVVKTCCALHNWLRESRQERDLDDRILLRAPRNGPLQGCLQDVTERQQRNHRREAARLRDRYADRFMTTDRVPWQFNMT